MDNPNAGTLLLKTALIIVLLSTLEIMGAQWLQPLDNWLSDLMVRSHAQALAPDPDIIIIDIDEPSLEKMAQHHGRWPWPRAIHAELIEGLQHQQPKAIVFDILFSDPDSIRSDSDLYFAETVQNSANVFLPIQLIETSAPSNWSEFGEILGFTRLPASADSKKQWGLILPFPPLEQTGRLGTINFTKDKDGVGRRYNLFMSANGWAVPSLSARVAKYLDYPLPTQQDIVLHWRGNRLAHQRISYIDLYEDINRRNPERDPQELKDKIIIIGTTATGLHDLRATPVSTEHPAVEILAMAIDNLKNQQYTRPSPPIIILLLTLLLIASLYFTSKRLQSPYKVGSVLVGITIFFLTASYLAVVQRYLFPVFTPLVFGWVFHASISLQEYIKERQKKERSIEMFSRFLDKRIVDELVTGDASQMMKSQSREITVLFSDIRGFTTLSEKRSAEAVLTLLNQYFSKQVQVIFKHGGTVDKFIGDAIMAFWGAPVDDPDHARNAVAAALDMADALEIFKSEIEDSDTAFDIGIGIHTGPAVVGFIGFEQRMEYTCIGDTVNLASRIEGQTKTRCRILVSAETKQYCEEAFDFIDHDSIKVKGREKPVHIFEPKRRPT